MNNQQVRDLAEAGFKARFGDINIKPGVGHPALDITTRWVRDGVGGPGLGAAVGELTGAGHGAETRGRSYARTSRRTVWCGCC